MINFCKDVAALRVTINKMCKHQRAKSALSSLVFLTTILVFKFIITSSSSPLLFPLRVVTKRVLLAKNGN